MGLSPEEKEQLDKLTQKANEPDESDDDFEIEIYNETGRGARLPYRKGRSWLQQTFGIDLDPPSKEGGDADNGDGGSGAPPRQTVAKKQDKGPPEDEGYWRKRR